MISLALHLSDWLSAAVPWIGLSFGFIGTVLAVCRELLKRVRLQFAFHATFIDEDHEIADVRQHFDGVPVVDAILMTITNRGRGVTIDHCQCEYRTSSGDCDRTVLTTAHVREYIERGKACDARLKVYFKPITFTSALAVDSVGKRRLCSRRELMQLNEESAQWWKKKLSRKSQIAGGAK